MKRKVYFVGVHNKPGLKPLDSSTKSGKLIDRVIEQLPEFECVKMNYYDCDYLPNRQLDQDYHHQNQNILLDKFDDNIIVVALGKMVQELLFPIGIPVYHPAIIWSKEAQISYIKDLVYEITTTHIIKNNQEHPPHDR